MQSENGSKPVSVSQRQDMSAIQKRGQYWSEPDMEHGVTGVKCDSGIKAVISSENDSFY